MRLLVLVFASLFYSCACSFAQTNPYDGVYTGQDTGGAAVNFTISGGAFASGGTSTRSVNETITTPTGTIHEDYLETTTTTGNSTAPAVSFSVSITHTDNLSLHTTNTFTGYDGTITVSGGQAVASGTFQSTNSDTGESSGTWSAATPLPPAPVLTSARTAAAPIGQPFTYQITTTLDNATSYAAQGLPDGLVLDPAAGVISGTPTAIGTSSVTLQATNAGGTGSLVLSLSVVSILSVEATGPSASDSGKKGTFTISRQGIDPAADLTVAYRVRGSAVPGVQFKKLPGTVVIPAGSATVKVRVKAIRQTGSHSTAKVKLVLLPEKEYAIGSPVSAVVKVLGNE